MVCNEVYQCYCVYWCFLGAIASTRSFYDNRSPFRVFNVNCSGNEAGLSECQHTISQSLSCVSNLAITVSCQFSKPLNI